MGAANIALEERQAENYYSTDPIVVNHLLEREEWLRNPNLKILEPAAGECSLVDRFYELTGNKMDAYDLKDYFFHKFLINIIKCGSD